MILIFGGTTEGRKVASVCDQAAKPFYYSTKGKTQQVDMANGIMVTGGLDEDSMISFCQKQNIKMIIDAAHPFAEALHQNIEKASKHLDIPVIRYEREYPKHDKDLLWFDTYDEAIEYLETNNIDNLLALTGVNTISKMKNYWLHHNCWFRILDRDESRFIVEKENFPSDKTLYYSQQIEDEDVFKELRPDAIITKESGYSGGFNDKIKAAQSLNIPVLVVRRPKLSPDFISVFGENGLRKQIEKFVPSFFELKTGYTTGTSATAATKAALIALLTKENVDKVSITLPNGEQVFIPIHSTTREINKASCSVIKDAGDDPDVTHGHEIMSTVEMNTTHSGVRFLQGQGVGKITLPGLGIEIGEPAINKTPRMMMKREIYKVMRHHQDKLPYEGLKTGIDVTISVPVGEEIAKKTFNPKLGIIGGISIIGTSGIVKPFSSEAFIASIRREMEVAKALDCDHIVINSGAKSEKFIKQQYPKLLSQAFIHYGNFIGETIQIASELNFEYLTMGIMIGKAVKLSEGFLDTHSKKVVMNKEFLLNIAKQANCETQTLEAIQNITMARQLWDIMPEGNHDFFTILLHKCYHTCKPLFDEGVLNIILIKEDGGIVQI